MSDSATIQSEINPFPTRLLQVVKEKRPLMSPRSEPILAIFLLDPGLVNTGSCTSSITFLNGEKGILRYRGYPIERNSRVFKLY